MVKASRRRGDHVACDGGESSFRFSWSFFEPGAGDMRSAPSLTKPRISLIMLVCLANSFVFYDELSMSNRRQVLT